MTKSIQIEVIKGDINSLEPHKMSDHVRVAIGNEIFHHNIQAWRKLIHSVEDKILNLHTVVREIKPK